VEETTTGPGPMATLEAPEAAEAMAVEKTEAAEATTEEAWVVTGAAAAAVLAAPVAMPPNEAQRVEAAASAAVLEWLASGFVVVVVVVIIYFRLFLVFWGVLTGHIRRVGAGADDGRLELGEQGRVLANAGEVGQATAAATEDADGGLESTGRKTLNLGAGEGEGGEEDGKG